jgi:glycosyltransferase involved in cell wall biosynthesis
MPVRNEALHLPAVLDSVAQQTFDHERLFFVAVDGDSTDESRDILRAWFAESGIAGRVISNPKRKIPIALNL